MTAGSQCATLACDSVGLLITILQLGQFVPQHYEMAIDRSVVGVSPWLLFFSSLYTFLAAVDTVILGVSDAFTCGESAYRCFVRDQPLIQMVGSAVLSIGMWYWFLKYHHGSDAAADAEERKLIGSFFYGTVSARAFFHAFLVVAAGFAFGASLLVVAFGVASAPVVAFAHACGVLAAVLNGLMWVPQIIVTYTFGHKGALSFGWVIASVVMDVAYSVYLASMGVHWTVWANNIPDGIQTAILLIMLVRFEYRDRRRGIDDYGNVIAQAEVEREEGALAILLKDKTVNRTNFV